MEELETKWEIVPQFIQVEAHPYFTQKELRVTLDKYGIKLMSWYPLGHGDTALMNELVFAGLGKKYGKTPAQVILRWHTQMGFVVIPGSKNAEHIKDNMDIFDFALTDEEMEQIAKLLLYVLPSVSLHNNPRSLSMLPHPISTAMVWDPIHLITSQVCVPLRYQTPHHLPPLHKNPVFHLKKTILHRFLTPHNIVLLYLYFHCFCQRSKQSRHLRIAKYFHQQFRIYSFRYGNLIFFSILSAFFRRSSSII